MDKFRAYEIIQNELSKKFLVGQFKCINHGLQFSVNLPDSKNMIRIYESKKKGLTVDVSQVFDDDLKKIIQSINLYEVNKVNYELDKTNFNSRTVGIFIDFKVKILAADLQILDYKLIERGAQFKVLFKNGDLEFVRIYNNGNIDLSLVDNYHNFEILNEFKHECISKRTNNMPTKSKNKAKPTTKNKSNKQIKKIDNQKRNKDKNRNRKQIKLEIKESKAQRPVLEDIANKIIHYVKR